MNFAFTEEQLELREMARAFLAEHSGSEAVRAAMESELGWDPAVWKQLGAELGWTAVLVPEEHGGLGLGQVEAMALMEVMGEALLCSPFFATVCLAGNAIAMAGTSAQQAALLPGIAEGTTTATLALGDAGAASAAERVSVTWRAEGGGVVLDGAAGHVPDGHSADLLIVPAREEGSDGADGLALFTVAGDADGLSRAPLPTMDATRRLGRITLDAVRVDAEARLGEARGADALAKALDLAAVALAAEQVGGAQRCLDLAVDYAKERVQYGRPIGSFQALKHTMADMMVDVEGARSAVYYAACAAAEDSDELPRLASMAKAVASDAYRRCAGDALQIFGGVGFTWEYDVHLYFKRARSSAVLLGEADEHRERVARELGL